MGRVDRQLEGGPAIPGRLQLPLKLLPLHLLPGVAQVELLRGEAHAVRQALQAPVHLGREGFELGEEGEDQVVLLVRAKLPEVAQPDHVVQAWWCWSESLGSGRAVPLTETSTAVQVVQASELCSGVPPVQLLQASPQLNHWDRVRPGALVRTHLLPYHHHHCQIINDHDMRPAQQMRCGASWHCSSRWIPQRHLTAPLCILFDTSIIILIISNVLHRCKGDFATRRRPGVLVPHWEHDLRRKPSWSLKSWKLCYSILVCCSKKSPPHRQSGMLATLKRNVGELFRSELSSLPLALLCKTFYRCSDIQLVNAEIWAKIQRTQSQFAQHLCQHFLIQQAPLLTNRV